MSYTIIYRFRKDGTAVKHAWLTNPWRGAMAIWQEMERRYLPLYLPSHITSKWWYRPGMTAEDISRHLGRAPTRTAFSTNGAINEIWDLADDPKVPLPERIVLCTTLDGILIHREDIPRVVEAFRSFQGNTTLPRQADILEQLFESDNCIAVGWDQNSIVSENWGNRGGYDYTTDTSLPYNCLTMTEHEWLFDTL